jgi:hypothetical protein
MAIRHTKTFLGSILAKNRQHKPKIRFGGLCPVVAVHNLIQCRRRREALDVNVNLRD